MNRRCAQPILGGRRSLALPVTRVRMTRGARPLSEQRCMRENGATGDCKAKASHGALSGLEPEHAENLGEARRGATFYATTAAAAPALGAGKAWDGLALRGRTGSIFI